MVLCLFSLPLYPIAYPGDGLSHRVPWVWHGVVHRVGWGEVGKNGAVEREGVT